MGRTNLGVANQNRNLFLGRTVGGDGIDQDAGRDLRAVGTAQIQRHHLVGSALAVDLADHLTGHERLIGRHGQLFTREPARAFVSDKGTGVAALGGNGGSHLDFSSSAVTSSPLAATASMIISIKQRDAGKNGGESVVAPARGLMVRHCRPDEPPRPDDDDDRDRAEDRSHVTLRGMAAESRRRGSDVIGEAAPVRRPVPFIRHEGSFNGIVPTGALSVAAGAARFAMMGKPIEKTKDYSGEAVIRRRSRWARAAGRDALLPERKERETSAPSGSTPKSAATSLRLSTRSIASARPKYSAASSMRPLTST